MAVLVGGLFLGSVAASAQEIPNGAIVMRSDGAIFVVIDGEKHQLDFAPATDEAIDALPDGERITDGVIPFERPSPVGSPTAPVATQPPLTVGEGLPVAGGIGDRVAVGDYIVTVVEVRPEVQSPQAWLLDPGTRAAGVLVRIENASTQLRSYTLSDFILRDTAGYYYEPQGHMDVQGEAGLTSGELLPAEHVLGWLVFEVLADATLTRLMFRPGGLLGGGPGVVISLGESSAPAEIAQGRRVVNGNYALTVVEIQDPLTQKTVVGNEGERIIGLLVRIENLGDEVSSFSTTDFKLRDSEGFEYNTYMVFIAEPRLSSGYVLPMDDVVGWLTFGVREEARIVRLTYTPRVGFSSKPPIVIALDGRQ